MLNTIEIPKNCVICASPYVSFVKTLFNKYGKGINLFYCMDCESFFSPFSKPNPPSSEVKWHKSVLERNVGWSTNLLTQIQAKSPIIDIGCGIGSLLLAAKQMGIEGIGFDLDEDACAHGSSEFDLELSATHWKREDKIKCGTITCISVLEHIHYPRPLLRDLVGAAKDNDCPLYISVPFVNRVWWKFLLDDNLTPGHIFSHPHVHVTHFSWKGLEKACREFGAKSFDMQKSGGWTGFLIKT